MSYSLNELYADLQTFKTTFNNYLSSYFNDLKITLSDPTKTEQEKEEALVSYNQKQEQAITYSCSELKESRGQVFAWLLPEHIEVRMS